MMGCYPKIELAVGWNVTAFKQEYDCSDYAVWHPYAQPKDLCSNTDTVSIKLLACR